jgi:hypothetical protein
MEILANLEAIKAIRYAESGRGTVYDLDELQD